MPDERSSEASAIRLRIRGNRLVLLKTSFRPKRSGEPESIRPMEFRLGHGLDSHPTLSRA